MEPFNMAPGGFLSSLYKDPEYPIPVPSLNSQLNYTFSSFPDPEPEAQYHPEIQLTPLVTHPETLPMAPPSLCAHDFGDDSTIFMSENPVAVHAPKRKRLNKVLQPPTVVNVDDNSDESLPPTKILKATTVKPSKKGITKKGKQAVKKKATIEVDSDSDTPITKTKVCDGKRWSKPETKKLLEALLDPDSIYSVLFKSNPTRVYKKVSRSIFNNTCAPHSVKSRYGRLFKMYKAIVRFEGWTGNGGGDPDVDERIAAARNAAVDLPPELNGKAIETFKADGYYDLFDQSVGEDPTIQRSVKHHSGVISDLEDENLYSSDFDSESDETREFSDDKENNPPVQSPLKTPTVKSSSQALQKSVKKQNIPGVPTPAFKGRSQQSLTSVSNDPALADYFTTTTAVLKSSVEEGKERMAWLKQRSDREVGSAKLQQLQAVIGNPNLNEDTRQLAKTTVLFRPSVRTDNA